MNDLPWHFLRRASQLVCWRSISLTVEGLENVPTNGAVILVSRHYHHLFDGCVLLATIDRPIHPLVALDWAQNPLLHRTMGVLCLSARWPVVLRSDPASGRVRPGAIPKLKKAIELSIDLLREGRVVLTFPEGYPTIDPTFTPKTHDDEFLSFQAGVVTVAQRAAAQGVDAKLIPVGLSYRKDDRWQTIVRFGEPVQNFAAKPTSDVVTILEREVRVLSADSR
ncbi:hypothetical protein BH23CHL5_BH23CHL5_25740 [soil metagenome]